jgi:hypothetical protein
MNNIIYNISSEYNNNTFTFTELGDNITFTLTNGYYTPSQLCTHVQNGMNASTLNGYIYYVGYNAVYSKFTITGTSNFDLPASTLGSFMGFASAVSGTNTYTSSNVSNISDPTYYYLCVSFVPSTGVSSSNTYFNFIVTPQNENELNNFEQCIQFAQPINVKQFTVTLKNRDNSLVQLNGTNYAFVLDLNTLN